MTKRAIPLILKFEDWPAQDRAVWPTLFERAALFEEAGAFERWSNPTKRAAQERYGQWLSYLARWCPEAFERPPAERITKEFVRGFLQEGSGRVKGITIMGWVTNLKMIAHALDQDVDWTWLDRAARYWSRVGSANGLKPPLPVTASAVLAWSLNRFRAVEAVPDLPPVVRALHYRDALMIGCLIACPVRSRAFAGMTTDQHLKATEGGIEFHFSKEDMKDGRERVYPLSPRLTEPLHRYLGHYRPALLRGRTSRFLWIGRSGRALTKDGLACHLKDVTRQRLGVPLRPHAFRHIAGTSIAEVDPQHVGIIRDILGHSTLEMAERHYNRAESVSACNSLQEIVRRLRRQAETSHSARGRLRNL